tara:strand:- start:349 stop:492 length:144 start_codon:yes stop_codon:yes gene_type:complete
MLKGLYKRVWVPFFGRLLAKFIPFLEGKPPQKIPTYDIDGDQKLTKK